MKLIKLYIPYFILTIISLINQVSGFSKEAIVGGSLAEEDSFKYLVEIMARRNFSDEYHSRCGGSLLSDKVVLSAAHCFMDSDGNLVQLTFSIMAATNILNDRDALYVDIDTIYRLKVYQIIYFNDIALATLKREIGIGLNNKLSKLNLPKKDEVFYGFTGLFAGFGHHWAVYKKNTTAGRNYRIISDRVDNYLRSASVKLLKPNEIPPKYSFMENMGIVLGTMIPENEDIGACTGDSGNALVINNIAAAILVATQSNCKDSNEGSFYLEVSGYIDFIEGIMTGFLTKNTLSFTNHPHIGKQLKNCKN